jgi:excisionase family DNA binding protein
MTDTTSRKPGHAVQGGDTASRLLPEKSFFSPKELSEYLDIPYATLAAWRCRGGGGPAWYRLGRHVRYRREDVLAWIEQNRGSS